LNSTTIAAYGTSYKFTTVLSEVIDTSGMSYISFILMFATGLIFLLLSFYCTGRKTVGAIIFPVLSTVMWAVLALATFIIRTGVVTFVDWIPSPIYVAMSILSALLGIWNVFNFVAESAKISVEED
jgi:hypothetical protein